MNTAIICLFITAFIPRLLKDKKEILSVFFVVILWIIMANMDLVSDRYQYWSWYETFETIEKNSSMEIGFQLFILLSKWVGLSFKQFMYLYTGIALLFLWSAVRNMTEHVSLVFVLYFLFPFILDSDQIRSFMGMTIALFGLSRILIGNNKTKDFFIFFLLCLVASLFQKSCLFYLAYFLMLVDRKKLFLIVLGFIVLIITTRVLIREDVLLSTTFARRIVRYFQLSDITAKNIVSFFYYAVILLFSLLVFCNSSYSKTALINIIIISMLILPFIILSDHFSRLIRLSLIIIYCYSINLYFDVNSTCLFNRFVFLEFVFIMAVLRFLVYYMGEGYQSYIIPLFHLSN